MSADPAPDHASTSGGPTPRLPRPAQRPQPGVSPELDPQQFQLLARYGTESDVVAGEVLSHAGERGVALIAILSGSVDIIESHESGERLITTYGPSEFVGEFGLLTGQKLNVTARMRTDGRVLRVPVEQLRTVLTQEPGLSDVVLRALLARRSYLTALGAGLTLVGSAYSADTRTLLEIFARNRLSFRRLDADEPEARQLLRERSINADELPVVLLPGGELLRNPNSRQLLSALGVTLAEPGAPERECDLLVVGAGPAGLAAAVYGASEGLATTLIESSGLGGQAGTSSRIENYLGFPAGVSGAELAARAALQAEKFDVHIELACRATALAFDDGCHRVSTDDGGSVRARSVIVATGARYHRLNLPGYSEFEGNGIFYAATQVEAAACARRSVVVIGGGNSAGQAALYLSRSCADVHLVIRGADLAASMSNYLIEEIAQQPRVTVRLHTQVTRLIGTETLEAVELTDSADQRVWTMDVGGLFVFIGAAPNTEWLGGELALDKHGFVLTGEDGLRARCDDGHTQPLTLETSRAGVFCVGDARSSSVKRVAGAIGEGSVAVRLVFDRRDAQQATPSGRAG